MVQLGEGGGDGCVNVGGNEGPLRVKEKKVEVRLVGKYFHTATPRSVRPPGIWKERSGKSTTWSEWEIWRGKNRNEMIKHGIKAGNFTHTY